MMFVARVLPVLRDVAASAEATAGGGGTTSCVPKSFPMMLLTNDPLAGCEGGGGTTVGAGRLSFAVR